MKFKFVAVLFLAISFNSYSQECLNSNIKLKLEDYEFTVSPNGRINVQSKLLSDKNNLKILAPLLGIKKIQASLNSITSSGKSCGTIKINIDPTLLCRDSSGNIEPWSYIVYQQDIDSPIEYSVVSKKTEITGFAKIRSSRICGYNVIKGTSSTEPSITIERSSIVSTATTALKSSRIVSGALVSILDSDIKGTFTIQDDISTKGDVNFSEVNIIGNPVIKSYSQPIIFKKVTIGGSPVMIDYNSKKKKEFLTSPSYYLDNVTITGDPLITAGSEGMNYTGSQIVGSPTISGDLVFTDSRIEGNGKYASIALDNGLSKLRSIIRDSSVLKGNNNFSGFFHINKRIENSTISGSVARDVEGIIVNTANLIDLYHEFNDSTFNGVGYIEGFVEANTAIDGYPVYPVTIGVIFAKSCGAINNSRMSGSIVMDSNVILDNAKVSGTFLKPVNIVHHITNSIITNSTMTGAPRVVNSTLYESYVSGSAFIANSHLGYSGATCNASVIGETLNNKNVGCGYPGTFKARSSEDVLLEADKIIADQIFKINEINEYAKQRENKSIQELKSRKHMEFKNLN